MVVEVEEAASYRSYEEVEVQNFPDIPLEQVVEEEVAFARILGHIPADGTVVVVVDSTEGEEEEERAFLNYKFLALAEVSMVGICHLQVPSYILAEIPVQMALFAWVSAFGEAYSAADTPAVPSFDCNHRVDADAATAAACLHRVHPTLLLLHRQLHHLRKLYVV